ncbi:uncharacterized protein B0T23DRAFT_400613 [Neurospora hispaniola]|uniref:Uncharacterized protein n=1 Tax=Neurospora hispaniola TaxID=588809 RepID=A0AAJ0MUP7_9PEZI|nr:hypothetical protein B0T23DRAFT_400613 [Neurospora hispaniola]
MTVQPTPSSTSSNSCRPHRLSASLAIFNRLADSQILYPGSTEDDDEGDKDNEYNEDDDIHDSDSGREARDAADDEYLARLKGDRSTGKDENPSNKHKTFDRWFITKPVPQSRPNTFTSALFPAQTFQAPNSSTPSTSHGSVSATFNAHGGLFESAFQGGFSQRADAIISIGGPGMGGDRQWTSETTCELAMVVGGTLVDQDIAHLDANPEEGKHTKTMDNIRWRNKNLFLARKRGDPDYLYDLDPRDFNRRFGEQARAAKQTEEEAARKRAEARLAFEKLYVLAREDLQPLRSAKEPSTTHSTWPARTKSYFYDTFTSSKKSKEPTTERPVQSAKTWPVRNLFTAKKKVEDFYSRAKESHMNAESETFGSIVKKFTFGSRNP